jgi:hypothetical protein
MEKVHVTARVQDNPLAVEVYANRFLGAFFDGNSVSLTFGSMRMAPPGEEGASPTVQPIVHVTQRLVLSPAATVEMINGIKQTLAGMKAARKLQQDS